ncbi:MAG TPA: hypothetical protein VMG08_00335 [Allosphingosinicella sp.]|nr:hypothetical protein [Allosphingosinicella sp.]
MKMLAILAVFLPAAIAAQTPGTEDPNERICRVTGELGSRLQRTRTCKTRAEWAEMRRETRNSIDRSQTRQVNLTVDGKVSGN